MLLTIFSCILYFLYLYCQAVSFKSRKKVDVHVNPFLSLPVLKSVWSPLFCLVSSPSCSTSSLMYVFQAHWNSVGCFFVTPLVNSSILFKQVHQLTHKALIIPHTYVECASGWDIQAVWDCEQPWSALMPWVRRSFFVQQNGRVKKNYILMTNWMIEVCSPNQFNLNVKIVAQLFTGISGK